MSGISRMARVPWCLVVPGGPPFSGFGGGTRKCVTSRRRANRSSNKGSASRTGQLSSPAGMSASFSNSTIDPKRGSAALAVHTVSARKDLSADEKIQWLLSTGRLHDEATLHETFLAAKNTYPKVDREHRDGFIQSVLSYRWPDEEDPEGERRAAWNHLDWLHWLHSAAPDCGPTKQVLDDRRTEFPDWSPSDHPDFEHWTEGEDGIVHHQSPWTVSELLGKPAAHRLPEFLSFQGTRFRGPDRRGLLLAVANAAKKDIPWALDWLIH